MIGAVVGAVVGVVVGVVVYGMARRMVCAGSVHVLVLHGAQHELCRVEAAAVVVVGGEVLKEVCKHPPLMRSRLHLRLAHELEQVTQRVLRQPHLIEVSMERLVLTYDSMERLVLTDDSPTYCLLPTAYCLLSTHYSLPGWRPRWTD